MYTPPFWLLCLLCLALVETAFGLLPSESIQQNSQLVNELRDLANKFADIQAEKPLGNVVLPGLPSFDLQTQFAYGRPTQVLPLFYNTQFENGRNATISEEHSSLLELREKLSREANERQNIVKGGGIYKDPILARLSVRPTVTEAENKRAQIMFFAAPRALHTMKKALRAPFYRIDENEFYGSQFTDSQKQNLEGQSIEENQNLKENASKSLKNNEKITQFNSDNGNRSEPGLLGSFDRSVIAKFALAGLNSASGEYVRTHSAQARVQAEAQGQTQTRERVGETQTAISTLESLSPSNVDLSMVASRDATENALRLPAFGSALRNCAFRRAGCIMTPAQRTRGEQMTRRLGDVEKTLLFSFGDA